jgi:hypothetical protein
MEFKRNAFSLTAQKRIFSSEQVNYLKNHSSFGYTNKQNDEARGK